MIVWAVLRAAALGIPLGAITGMPLGVINIAIVDAATAGRRRFALGLALGGGAADALHALLGFGGVGRVVTENPAIVRVLAIGATLAIVLYAVFAWRYRRKPRDQNAEGGCALVETEATTEAAPTPAPHGRPDETGRFRVAHGTATGLVLTGPNPAALAAWVALAAAIWPGATIYEAAGLAGGVCAGSMVWFSSLARWVSRVRPDHPLLTVIPKIALVLLVGTALLGVARVLL